MKGIRNLLADRFQTLLCILVIVPVGCYSKFYRGPAQNWVRYSLGGVFYVIFWCLVVFLLFPKLKRELITSAVLISTCILEFTQLWHPVFLEYLRGNFIGRTILGTTFMWSDFPYYFVGAGIGWLCLGMLRERKKMSGFALPRERSK